MLPSASSRRARSVRRPRTWPAGSSTARLWIAASKRRAPSAPGRAAPLLEQQLAYARAAGDRFLEKAALDRLGLARAGLGDLDGAVVCLGKALALARAAGDRKHEAELSWALAVQHAEQGRRGPALAHAQAAVGLLQRGGKPQAAWFAHHLEAYRTGAPEGALAAEAAPGDVLGGGPVPGLWGSGPGAGPAGGRAEPVADGAVGSGLDGPVPRLGAEDRLRRHLPQAAGDVCRLRAPHGVALPGVRLLHRGQGADDPRGLPPRPLARLNPPQRLLPSLANVWQSRS
jgi:hypothetical protein